MRHEELSGGACDSWRSPPQSGWRTACRHPPLEEHPTRALCSAPPPDLAWSLAGGGSIGNLSGHSPASALSPGKIMSVSMPSRNLFRKHGARHTIAATSRFAPHFFSACWAELPLVGQPPRARLPASKAPPAEHHWYAVIRNKHGWVMVSGLRSQLPGKLEIFQGSRP